MDKDEEWRLKEELKEQVMVRRERIIARMEKERGSEQHITRTGCVVMEQDVYENYLEP